MPDRHTRNAGEIRREVEDQWFALHEAELIAAARRRREAEQKPPSTGTPADHWKKCPHCGADMHSASLEEVQVEKCNSCDGIFFERGELERLLLSHDRHRRTFFRWLLGFAKTEPKDWSI